MLTWSGLTASGLLWLASEDAEPEDPAGTALSQLRKLGSCGAPASACRACHTSDYVMKIETMFTWK